MLEIDASGQPEGDAVEFVLGITRNGLVLNARHQLNVVAGDVVIQARVDRVIGLSRPCGNTLFPCHPANAATAAASRQEALAIGRQMCEKFDLLEHVCDPKSHPELEDGFIFYRFTERGKPGSSLSTLLGEGAIENA